KKESWEIIISSPLIRARATARIIAEEISMLDIMEDQRICEIDCGHIEGTTEEERLGAWGHSWRELDLGMERYEDVAERGAQFLEEVMQTYGNKNILVGSHGAGIGLSLQNLLPQRYTTTYMNNASLTLLTKSNGEW
ncbi:histidine phosphatase family protein, partial [Clostridium perfringens]